MDDADRADEVYELSLQHALFMARNCGPLTGGATGACFSCGAPIAEPGRRWCAAACRDSWERAQRHA